MHMPVISIANQKGGCSKTSSVACMAAVLNKRGYKTLCLDLDPQSSLSASFGILLQDEPTVYNMLKGEVSAKEIIHSTKSGDLIPSNILLSGADTEFSNTGREYLLKEALADIIDNYSFVLIDCPPSLSILTINALTASTHTIIPVLGDAFSLQGLAMLSRTIQRVKKYCNASLEILGILLTRYNERIKLSSHVKKLLENATETMGTKLFNTHIRTSIGIQEAQFKNANMLDYAEKSNAMIDYQNFVDELLEDLNNA